MSLAPTTKSWWYHYLSSFRPHHFPLTYQAACRANGWPLDKATLVSSVTSYRSADEVTERPAQVGTSLQKNPYALFVSIEARTCWILPPPPPNWWYRDATYQASILKAHHGTRNAWSSSAKTPGIYFLDVEFFFFFFFFFQIQTVY